MNVQVNSELIPDKDSPENLKIELQSQHECMEEVVEEVSNLSAVDKSQPTVVPPLPKKKPKFITHEEIQSIEKQYDEEMSVLQGVADGDNSLSEGIFSWTPKTSCFTKQNKTQLKEEGVIQLNRKEKLVNVPVLPFQNEFALQLQLKIKRGEEVQIKSVGVDRKLVKRLVISLLHTGFSFKLRILVPTNANVLKIWKEIELPLKLNQNNNIQLSIKENFEGRLFVKLNGIQFVNSLKLSHVTLFYFLVSCSTMEKVKLSQTAMEKGEDYGKCETNCSIF